MTKKTYTTIAIGATSVAAAGFAAYWLYGTKNAPKHRHTLSSWVLKARAEVMNIIEKIGYVDKQTYLEVVDDVLQKYADTHASASDLATVTKEMREAWTHIVAASSPAKKIANRVTKKVRKGLK